MSLAIFILIFVSLKNVNWCNLYSFKNIINNLYYVLLLLHVEATLLLNLILNVSGIFRKSTETTQLLNFLKKPFIWKMVKFHKEIAINRNSHRRFSIKKGLLKSLVKFTRKHLRQSVFFNKVAGLNFAKFLRTPFLQNTSRQLLLKMFWFKSYTRNGKNGLLKYIYTLFFISNTFLSNSASGLLNYLINWTSNVT